MLNVALTGNIAAGKSTVVSWLRRWGATIIDAAQPVRRARLRALRGLSNEEADRMIASQMDAERKRARSQYVIDNDGSLKELEAKARAVFKELMHRARSTKPLP